MRVTDSGTSFSDLHAVVQAWHPIHRVWSMTFAHKGSVLVSAVVMVIPLV